MQAEIRISARDDVSQYTELLEWLRGERALAGAVSARHRRPGEDELGGAFDMLAVALGSGGAVVALANSLTAWLQTRRPDVSITVTSSSGSVKLDARRIKDADALTVLQEVLGSKDGS
jgi:hypothetical protein